MQACMHTHAHTPCASSPAVQSNNCDLHASLFRAPIRLSVGGVVRKREEIAVNLWVIENVYIPSRVHFYLLCKQPFYLCDPHLLQQAPGWKPFPTLPSGSHWMLVPMIAGVVGGGWWVTHLCACLHRLHLLSAAGIDARLLFLPAQGVKWFVWRLGGGPSGA